MQEKLYQVFVGCPFAKALRKNYDRLKRELERETPLHIILADTAAISSTDYLLEHITALIRESAACIFDATGGNPNVSLEVGIAHALPSEFILALSTRKLKSQKTQSLVQPKTHEIKPIIRLSGRTLRTGVVAQMDDTGINPDDLLGALSDAKLVVVKRGRHGGIYYPGK